MKRNASYQQLSSQCIASSMVPTKQTVQVRVCVNYSSQVKSYGWKSSLSCLQLSSSSSLLCLHSFQSARVGMFSTASLARTSLCTHTKTHAHKNPHTVTLWHWHYSPTVQFWPPIKFFSLKFHDWHFGNSNLSFLDQCIFMWTKHINSVQNYW